MAKLFVYSYAIMEALEMERPMTEWNDDRLDELNGRVNDGFIAVDKRFEQVNERFIRLEGEMKEGFAKVDERFEETATREEMGEVKADIRSLSERFDRLLHGLLVISWGFAGTVLAAVIGLIAVVLF